MASVGAIGVDVDTKPERVFFPAGLVGCPAWNDFVLRDLDELPGLLELELVADPSVVLILARVLDVQPDFFDLLAPEDRAAIDGLSYHRNPAKTIYCSLTVREGGQVTANLLGPIVIDHARGTGVQIVLADSRLSARHPLTSPTE